MTRGRTARSTDARTRRNTVKRRQDARKLRAVVLGFHHRDAAGRRLWLHEQRLLLPCIGAAARGPALSMVAAAAADAPRRSRRWAGLVCDDDVCRGSYVVRRSAAVDDPAGAVGGAILRGALVVA